MKRNLVVGAGFSGATIARLLAENSNEEVLVIDRRSHIAGNSYDYFDKNGIMVQQYGSHIFHTDDQEVWSFLERFSDFNTYQHRVLGLIEGKTINIPFNFDSLYQVFPEGLAKKLEVLLLDNFVYQTKVSISEFQKLNIPELKFLSDYIFQQVFLNYSRKQWGIGPEQLDKSVMARVPVYLSRDPRYFYDKYQGIPLNGFTNLIKNMLNHPKIHINLNCSYDQMKQQWFDRIFYTGSIDEFFDYQLGKLPYRSLSFKWETHPIEFYQENAVINYPNNYDFTRIHEYKYYLQNRSSVTIIAKEYSTAFEIGKNERYYPIVSSDNHRLYQNYLDKVSSLPNIYFLGRLGDYRYYNLDQTVRRAMDLYCSIA